MFQNNFAIIVHATNLRHFGAFLVCLMTFLMKVYHAMYMYQYFLLDAFSMNDVNKAEMTEKESKVTFQVKRSFRSKKFIKCSQFFHRPSFKINSGSNKKDIKLWSGYVHFY